MVQCTIQNKQQPQAHLTQVEVPEVLQMVVVVGPHPEQVALA